MIEINKLHFISLFGSNSDMILLAAEHSLSQSSREWNVGWLADDAVGIGMCFEE